MSKTAIVTGAGSGIGRAAALALLADGYRVGLLGRREAPLVATAAASGREGQALVLPADVTRPEQVNAAFGKMAQAWGRLDVLFNNAGVWTPAVPIDQIDYAEWKAVLDTNLSGMFLCAQAAFRLMKDQRPRGGRIINNGSLSAHTPRPGSAAYTTTKHAVTGLTKCLSLDGRAHDIACGQIDIGNAATEMSTPMTQGVPQPGGHLAVEPRFDVAHVGSAVLYMANLPLDANVQFITIMATKMPYIGRG